MKASLSLLVLCGLCLAVVVVAQPAGDLVTSLPNLNGTLWLQYSGYVTVNETYGRALHYWFIQSQSSTPESDPVVLWLNGGPGCSSLDGLLYENGPYHFFSSNESDFTLSDNPYSWNQVANVIYLEAPAGVGFSYTNTTADLATNDWQTANDNFNFLVWFFNNFTAYSGNDFYIAGESYAGVYVPTLAKVTYENQDILNATFKGIMVGNGVTDEYFDSPLVALVPFVYGHALIGYQTYFQLTAACSDYYSNACQELMMNVSNIFTYIDIYNVIGECYGQRSIPTGSGSPNGPVLVPPCTDAYKASIWLNMPEVKDALHVRQDITWGLCDVDINANYTSNAGSMLKIYPELIAGGIDILIYSGDVDAAVPFPGTEAWTYFLMKGQAIEYWQPWTYNDTNGMQIGGYKTTYEGLTFITVKGAGHMVPQYQPQAAYVFFSRYLNGTAI